MTPLTPAPPHTEPHQALDFDCGVRAYSPTHPDGYWLLGWMEADRRRETTATSKDRGAGQARRRGGGPGSGTAPDWAQAKGEALVAHYLDSSGTGPGARWSLRHREEQKACCERFVTRSLPKSSRLT